MASVKHLVVAVNDKISKSTFGRVFRLEGSGHPNERKDSKFLTEIYAGLTTFFTMAYIITVNAKANILSQTGGTCVCPGIDPNDVLCDKDASYGRCLSNLNRDLITATTIISGISSIAFGFLTNLPVALAPGMGLNAYFTFQVVGYHGSGFVSYRLALTAVFIEGCIFIFLSLIGMRQWLIKVIPSSIKVASGVGIGFFISEIGMSYSGIGLISGGVATPTSIAGCPPQYLDPASGSCTSHTMTNPTLWLGILGGGVLTVYLMAFRVKSAIIIGICVVSILSWPRGTPITFFPDTIQGDEMFSYFKKVVHFHPISQTLVAQDWAIISQAGSHFALALFTFLYVDIIDATATLYSMARFSGVVDPSTGDFPRSTLAYCTDAACISIGSLFGCSPVTAFIESGAGITVGGKTGLTAITTGVCFLISMFFAPIFASIPPWATGCTLIIVGYLMMRQVVSINWGFIGDALPAFITIIMMPYSYSVAYGLIAGLFSYAILNGLIWVTKLVTKGRLQPVDTDLKEYWTYKTWGRELPWFLQLAQEKLWFRGQEGTWEEQRLSDARTGSKDDDISLKSGVGVAMGSERALVTSDYGEREGEGK